MQLLVRTHVSEHWYIDELFVLRLWLELRQNEMKAVEGVTEYKERSNTIRE